MPPTVTTSDGVSGGRRRATITKSESPLAMKRSVGVVEYGPVARRGTAGSVETRKVSESGRPASTPWSTSSADSAPRTSNPTRSRARAWIFART
jgi:hypothetical protein